MSSRPTEERRVVSVMFSDLAGFTEQTEQSYLEDVRERLTVYHRTAREMVEAHGGRVEKLMGDGVFAVFGFPTTHEDDPERAVRAGLALQTAIVELNDSDPDLSLVVRVAVTTGEALVQLDDDPDRESIVGDVVNTASRLEAVAPVGRVIVDERTYVATERSIDFDDLDPVDLKGKAEATSIWLATRAGEGEVAIEAGPFVGRKTELNELIEAQRRSAESSTVEFVTVVGEPGAGKSRLIHELGSSLRAGPTEWREGRCLPYGEGITFWALGEIVKDQAGIFDSDTPAETHAKLHSAVVSLIDDPTQADWVHSRLALLVGGTSEEQQIEPGELISAWLHFFEAMGRQGPLVVVVEDIHWAEDGMLDFLERIATWDAGVPMLLVATARPELLTRRPDWPGKVVNLDALSDDHAGDLLTALLERGRLGDTTRKLILEQAGGNPLYLTEFVRLIEDRGAIDSEDVVVPDSVQSVIAARLDLLDGSTRELLQAAAVVGKVFWSGAVAALRPDSAGIEELVYRAMIRPVPDSSMLHEDEYAFTHALVRDVAYGQITRYDRAALHEATADWIETTGRSIDVAELVAYHLGETLDLTRRPDPALRNRAYRTMVLAGERARGLDPVHASSYYRKAADTATEPTDRADALMWAGRAVQSAEPGMSTEPLEEAHELYRAEGDVEGEAAALADLVYVRTFSLGGDPVAVNEQSEESVRLIEGRPDSEAKAHVLMARARQLLALGLVEEVVAAADRAAPVVYSVGSVEDQILLRNYRGRALAALGEEEGFEEMVTAMHIADDHNFTHHMLSTRLHLAGATTWQRSPVDALPIAEDGLRLADERGQSIQVMWFQSSLAGLLFDLGDWERALAMTDQVGRFDEAHGGGFVAGTTLFLRMWILFLQGHAEQAWAMWKEIRGMTLADDPQITIVLGAGVFFAYFFTGDTEEAHRLADEYESAAFATDRAMSLAFTTAALARLGDADRIEALLGLFRDTGSAGNFTRKQVEGHLAQARGDFSGAAERFLEAAAIADLYGKSASSLIARAQAAAMLIGDDRFDKVEGAARRDAEDLGAAGLIEFLDAGIAAAKATAAGR